MSGFVDGACAIHTLSFINKNRQLTTEGQDTCISQKNI